MPIKSDENGEVDLLDLERHLDEDVAALMITVPNTLGLFESRTSWRSTGMCHAKGAQVYVDGANLNALLGITRPGDLGFDVVHINLHKTFTTPHGGGGPGPGRSRSRRTSRRSCRRPSWPATARRARLDWKRPQSIGKMQAFWGNFGMLVRAYTYIRTLGPDGLRAVSRERGAQRQLHPGALLRHYDLPYERPSHARGRVLRPPPEGAGRRRHSTSPSG